MAPIRVAYLGPAGTFSDDALSASTGGVTVEKLPQTTVHDAIVAVQNGEAERAFVPFENSIEGAVRSALDALALDGSGVVIVGEYDHPVHHNLIARTEIAFGDVTVLLSHPQAIAQCAQFIRENLQQAEVRVAPSTAEGVRLVGESQDQWAALGATSAAELYGCTVLREGVEDDPDNVTRFVWIAPEGTVVTGGAGWKTSLVFAELGEDHPGALVEALLEFSSRDINLTRIESRPLGAELGRYMFFIDLEGSTDDQAVSSAIQELKGKAEWVRVLGSYPISNPGVPGA